MRTPTGRECRFFYGNYFRGREQEECRLLADSRPLQPWTSDLCATCPVPDILQANACEHMVLHARVTRGLLGLRRRVQVTAYCLKRQAAVDEPHVGCGLCHPPLTFLEGDQPLDEPPADSAA